MDLRRLQLTAAEASEIDGMTRLLRTPYGWQPSTERMIDLRTLAQELPRRIRSALNAMRLQQRPRVLVISGGRLDQARIGPTPSTRILPTNDPRTCPEETLLVMYGLLLGEVFGWSTQQDGRMVNDVLPVAGEERRQMGSSSSEELLWHTEDAFHEARADYVGLMCLRNPQHAATTVGHLAVSELDMRIRSILAEPRFLIRPDLSHDPSQNVNSRLEAFDRVSAMHQRPEHVAVLFGDPDDPCIRLDPAYMSALPGDDEARLALDTAIHSVQRHLVEIVLEPGDVCVLDNYRVVHGRRPFAAQYDGTDRWLKRINVSRDLRHRRLDSHDDADMLVG